MPHAGPALAVANPPADCLSDRLSKFPPPVSLLLAFFSSRPAWWNLPAPVLGGDVLLCSSASDPTAPADSLRSLVDIAIETVGFRSCGLQDASRPDSPACRGSVPRGCSLARSQAA